MFVTALALVAAPGLATAQMAFTRTTLPGDTGNARRLKRDSTARRDTVRDTTARKNKPTFSNEQQGNQRVLDARLAKRFELKKLFRDRGLTYPAAETFMRIFKRERILEVWVRSTDQTQFKLLKTYPICAMAGALGPKRQTPEGFYYIDGFNPVSDFHLSLKLDYPNRSDQLLSPEAKLGGNIFIHGGCKTEGCLAVTDDAIKELYWLAVEARNLGQQMIPVHIFPTRLTDGELQRLGKMFANKPTLPLFWQNLKTGYDYFESQHKLPVISVEKSGYYRLQAPPRPLDKPTVPTGG
jgi:murein L,D-transpeptidase YafK